MLRTKVIRAETKVIDAEKGEVEAVVSTETQDRDGDIIRQSGWQLDRFNQHPILLSSHNYGSLQSQIGDWRGMKVARKQLSGIATYYIGKGNAEADWGFELAKAGRAAFSVGFIPDMDEASPLGESRYFGPFEFKSQELLEVSQVTVPSNPDALQRMKTAVGVSPDVVEIIDDLLRDTTDAQAAKEIERGKALDAISDRVMTRVRQEFPDLLREAGVVDLTGESDDAGETAPPDSTSTSDGDGSTDGSSDTPPDDEPPQDDPDSEFDPAALARASTYAALEEIEHPEE